MGQKLVLSKRMETPKAIVNWLQKQNQKHLSG